MLFALFFLGTWPTIWTLLERRGWLPQHTYLDYTFTNLLAAVIIAFTFGEIDTISADEPNFLTQLSQDNWLSVFFEMAGGVVLSLGNLSTQYAWAFVICTTLNYFLDDKINKAEILFPGVGCFLIIVCLVSAVHASNAADNEAELNSLSQDYKTGKGAAEVSMPKETNLSVEKKEYGSADFLIELENRRAIKVFGKSTMIGLAITFFAGVCFSLFSPAFNLATNDQWNTLKDSFSHLTVYIAFFYFSVSCFVLAIILNVGLLYHLLLNLPRSSVRAYLSNWNSRC